MIRKLWVGFHLIALFVGCSQKHTPATGATDIGYTKATVIDSRELDGCTFLLELPDGTKLEPTNLPDAFKKHNLAVKIKYIPNKEVVSICMAGKMITITDIKKDD